VQSVSAATDQSHQLTPKQSLWVRAYDKLSDVDKKALPFPQESVKLGECLDDILQVTKESADKFQDRDQIQLGSTQFSIRDLTDKTLMWVDKFKEIGDTVVQYDPGHAALPWAAVRFVLQVCSS
jgi:hypothetical protein